MIVPATSSTQPNKAGCRKNVIRQDQINVCENGGLWSKYIFLKLYTVLGDI